MMRSALAICRELCQRAGHTHAPGSREEAACLAKRLLLVELAAEEWEHEHAARDARAHFYTETRN